MNKTHAITTGDIVGIGLEVACKALNSVGPKKGSTFFLFRSANLNKTQKQYLKLLEKKFVVLTFHNIKAAISFYAILKTTKSIDTDFLFDISSSDTPAQWVLDCTLLAKNKFFSSLITGPISKRETQKLKNKPIGHTGIFRQVFPQHHLNMAFWGKHFHVILATDHISLSKVERTLTPDLLKKTIVNSLKFHSEVKSKPPIQVLGLNPHAGEKNILGIFEEKKLIPILKKLKNQKISLPLSSDTAFNNYKNSNKVFLALYHDQGLIPFKMIHGQETGVHITLGLPFIRTSVDHGTAVDIYNKNIANFSSMREAIELALRLSF